MSFKCVMEINSKKFNVLHVHYNLYQETDATGRPSSVVRGGKIEVTVESTGETTLYELMIEDFTTKEGKITYMKRESDAKLKELEFKDAYVVAYGENYDHVGMNALVESITISANEIKMGSGTHNNEWPKVL